MTPRLNEAQELNIQEMRRMMRSEVELAKRPVSWRVVWVSLVVGVLAAATMDHCHRESEAQAAYRATPSADAVQLSSDCPITRRDWNAQQEAAVAREYGKIAGSK